MTDERIIFAAVCQVVETTTWITSKKTRSIFFLCCRKKEFFSRNTKSDNNIEKLVQSLSSAPVVANCCLFTSRVDLRVKHGSSVTVTELVFVLLAKAWTKLVVPSGGSLNEESQKIANTKMQWGRVYVWKGIWTRNFPNVIHPFFSLCHRHLADLYL